MAFDPIHVFRKYQKFWMAAILLMCMITFVLCQGGKQGDLGDLFEKWMGRHRGSVVAELNNSEAAPFFTPLLVALTVASGALLAIVAGMFVFTRKLSPFWLYLTGAVVLICLTGLGVKGATRAFGGGQKIYREELEDIVKKRKAADQFMMEFCKYVKTKAEEELAQADKNPDQSADQPNLEARESRKRENERIVAVYGQRAKKKPYFGGGYSLDELINFKLWLMEADRLKIKLDEKAINELVQIEFGKSSQLEYAEAIRGVMAEIYKQHDIVASSPYILSALSDEFRVHLAQQAMIGSQPGKFFSPQDLGIISDERESIIKGLRVPITPAQMWEFYKKNRAESSVIFAPVDVKYFLSSQRAPSEQEIQVFFNEYREKTYDPKSDKPGFGIPLRIKIAWVTADPAAEKFKNLDDREVLGAAGVARLLTSLEVFPLPIVDPLLPSDLNLVRYAIGPSAEQVSYKSDFKEDTDRLIANLPPVPPPIRSGIVDTIQLKDAQWSSIQIAGFVGALANRAEFLGAYRDHPPGGINPTGRLKAWAQRQKGVEITATRGATTVGLGCMGGFPVAQAWFDLTHNPRYQQKFPFPDEVAKYRELREKKRAIELVQYTMAEVRKKLEDKSIQGRENPIYDTLHKKLEGWPFEYHETKNFYDTYTIDQAPELESLHRSFDKYFFTVNIMEGRPGNDKSKPFKETDFFRLFFEGDPHAAHEKLKVRAWPPTAVVNPSAVLTSADFNKLPLETRATVQELKRTSTPGQTIKVDLSKSKIPAQSFLFWRSQEEPATSPVLEKEANLKKIEETFAKDFEELAFNFVSSFFRSATDKQELAKELERFARDDQPKLVLRSRVETAWKVKQIRESKALARAKEVGDNLKDRKKWHAEEIRINENKALPEAVRKDRLKKLKDDESAEIKAIATQESLGLGQSPPILLSRIAPLFQNKITDDKGHVNGSTYSPYAIDKEDKKKFVYPGHDLAQQVLLFLNPEAPLKWKMVDDNGKIDDKVDYKELDKRNEELFANAKDNPDCRLVQVLTNQPRTVFYVAVVVSGPTADLKDFLEVCKNDLHEDRDERDELQKRVGDPLVSNSFVDVCFEKLSRENYDVLLKQLRNRMGFVDKASDDDRKAFDTGGN